MAEKYGTKKKFSHTLNIKACVVFTIFFLFLFSFGTHDMLFSLITFTEQQGESLLHLFEVFGGSHRFGPENEKKNSIIVSMNGTILF